MSTTFSPSVLRCVGCGFEPGSDQVLPFACANADSGDGREHILVRHLAPPWIRRALTRISHQSSATTAKLRAPSGRAPSAVLDGPGARLRAAQVRAPRIHGHFDGLAANSGEKSGLDDADCATGTHDPNPFVRFRHGLHAWHNAIAWGFSDAQFVDLVGRLNDRIALVDGAGFAETPFLHAPMLATMGGPVWIKNETNHVSGSHKARHLFNILLWVQLQKERGVLPSSVRFAIASCGNAALAAAVLARAANIPLDVFIPVNAERSVVDRLTALGATIQLCPRQPHEVGDPCYLRFREAVTAGALPFCCQGPDNGLAVEGGLGLGWEIVVQATAAQLQIDRVFVQVGGGALGSAVAAALMEAVDSGYCTTLPQIIAVQTDGCAPLSRAYDRLRAAQKEHGWTDDETLEMATKDRRQWMWPWEHEPHSLAHGILDDETYDWYGLMVGMFRSGGYPVVAPESAVIEAAGLGPRETGIDVCPTGTSGLAGLLTVAPATTPRDGVTVLLFTGHRR